MRALVRQSLPALWVALAISALATLSTGPTVAGETGPQASREQASWSETLSFEAQAPGASASIASDPCTFYRGQAWGRGLTHFTTEMLWACEAVQDRRRAGFALSPRLVEVEAALERYRVAFVEIAVAAFARDRARSMLRGAAGGDAGRMELAERTGTLAALESIRTGF